MAELALEIMRSLDWTSRDVLQLVIGSENAASLAESDPAGGEVVAERRPWSSEDGVRRGGFGVGPFGVEPFGVAIGNHGLGEGRFGLGPFGLNDAPPIVLAHRYIPTDKCASLPVGVQAVDEAGNVSVVTEQLVDLADAPAAPGPVQVAAGENPGEIVLTWTASADI